MVELLTTVVYKGTFLVRCVQITDSNVYTEVIENTSPFYMILINPLSDFNLKEIFALK